MLIKTTECIAGAYEAPLCELSSYEDNFILCVSSDAEDFVDNGDWSGINDWN